MQDAEGRGGFGQEAAFPDSSRLPSRGHSSITGQAPDTRPCFMPAVTLQGGFFKPGGRQGQEGSVKAAPSQAGTDRARLQPKSSANPARSSPHGSCSQGKSL